MGFYCLVCVFRPPPGLPWRLSHPHCDGLGQAVAEGAAWSAHDVHTLQRLPARSWWGAFPTRGQCFSVLHMCASVSPLTVKIWRIYGSFILRYQIWGKQKFKIFNCRYWWVMHYVFPSLDRSAWEAGAASCHLQSAWRASSCKLQHIRETHLPPRQVTIFSS